MRFGSLIHIVKKGSDDRTWLRRSFFMSDVLGSRASGSDPSLSLVEVSLLIYCLLDKVS